MKQLFYKPIDAWCGDFIPFYKDGAFRLFYLKSYRDEKIQGIPWFQIATSDFLHFEELGKSIPQGTMEEQDYCVFTGSVLEAQGKYHIFYTGHNPHFRQAGKPEQAIMHAISDDLIHWTKVPEDTFTAFEAYEANDWRDPFVFYAEKENLYYMLLAAREKDGLKNLNGVTALCSSKDLKHWESCGELWQPGLYLTHECPDLFQIGDWWYLIYSEFTDKHLTRYRMAKDWHGPWIKPADDAFDGIGYYAAKSFSDGDKRYLFGWIPTREGNDDEGRWHWGGSLGVHELFLRADGTLGVKMPDSIAQAGLSTVKAENITLDEPNGRAVSEICTKLPEKYRIDMQVSISAGTDAAGILLGANEEGYGYFYAFKPSEGRVTFDNTAKMIGNAGLERPLKNMAERTISVSIISDGEICIAYIDGQLALSARMYDKRGNAAGVFVCDGKADFQNISIWDLNQGD